MNITVLERFERHYTPEPNSGCWIWTAEVRGGYGRFWDGQRKRQAHAFAYEHLSGPIPDGLEIDHLCRNRACVNPAHMEPVTSAENNRRADPCKARRALTHCPQGHPYSGDNLYVYPNGKRRCRVCARDATARLRERVLPA